MNEQLQVHLAWKSKIFSPEIYQMNPPKMKKSEQLQQKIAELQKELARVKNMEEVPKDFNREVVLDVIYDPKENYGALDTAFNWADTTQGYEYWDSRCEGHNRLSSDDIIQLQQWVIVSYHNQYGM